VKCSQLNAEGEGFALGRETGVTRDPVEGRVFWNNDPMSSLRECA